MDVTTVLSSFGSSVLSNVLAVPLLDKYFTVFTLPLAILFFAGFVFFIEKDSRRVKLMLLGLVLTFITFTALKAFYGEARPCVELLNCATGNGFPSGHASMTFILAFTLIGSSVFPLALIFALYASLMRVVTGFHSFTQVAAGMALAFFIAFTLNEILLRKKQFKAAASEEVRQTIHFIGGFVVLGVVLFMPFEISTLILSLGLLLGVFLMHSSFKRAVAFHGLTTALGQFERGKVTFGKGATAFVGGTLFAMLFARPLEAGIAVIAILTVADAVSTLVGVKFGRHKLPFNKYKSFEGSAAFLIFGFVAAAPFIGLQLAALYSFILMIVEMLPVNIDDNLTISTSGTFLSLVLKKFTFGGA